MKKIIALLLAALMVAACFAGCGTNETNTPDTTPDATGNNNADTPASDMADVIANGKLVVGITEYEPMDYLDENNEWTGFDAEFARLFAEELGVDCEFFVLGDWGKKFFELDAKTIDCVWNGMTITDEALNNASVSDPYVVNAQVVVMKADKLADYQDVESMKALTFAVEEGSAGQSVAEENGLTTIAKQDQAGALLEVVSGASDACVIDITMAYAMTGEGSDYADLGVGISLSTEEYGVAFRKDSDLTAKFNDFMAGLKESGQLQTLADKYQLTLAD
ncbi:MAG: transporter substrate-binding domain-containing protein [Oscillospiraceae bacterium]|nr:transporter substrate-binding domain-containing protein [Oscillospiraceae bacterium]